MIEALLATNGSAEVSLHDIRGFLLFTNPRWLAVCDIKRPRTGLEVKFSYNWLAGMTLRGDDTGDDRGFTDSIAQDDELVGFAEKISIKGDDNLTDLQARGEIDLKDGCKIPIWFDLAAPLAPEALAEKLQRKSSTIIGNKSTAIWSLHGKFSQLGARDIGAVLLAAGAEGELIKS